MGGLRLPASADAILSAVAADVAGNPLELHRLQRVLMQRSSPDVDNVLTGLTHVTSRVLSGTAEAASLRRLVDVALQIDVVALATGTLNASNKTFALSSGQDADSSAVVKASPSLTAFSTFATNLISVDASYVESFLFTVIPRIFLAQVDGPGAASAIGVAHNLIGTILSTHPRAERLLSDALCRRYPHPVRSSEEHVAYARSVLQVARSSLRFGLTQRIIDAVFERLVAIEALMSNTDFVTSSDGLNDEDSVSCNLTLTPDAEKLQLVLLELIGHIRLAHSQDPGAFAKLHLKSIFSAHEALVVPVYRPRASPYILLLAIHLAGVEATTSLAERLRQSFHDPTIPDRLRASFLEHSATIIVRARLISTRAALRWTYQIAAWLNIYIDALNNSPEMVHVDVDIHHLFYTACAVLMSTLSRRTDIIRGPTASETLARLRLYRILNCSLSPMTVIPVDVVNNFVSVINKHGHLDLGQIYADQKQKVGPTRTRNGALNLFTYSFGCPDLELPLVREAVNPFVRWDHPSKVLLPTGSALDEPRKKVRFENIETPVTTLFNFVSLRSS